MNERDLAVVESNTRACVRKIQKRLIILEIQKPKSKFASTCQATF
jgi:hypothetical protein